MDVHLNCLELAGFTMLRPFRLRNAATSAPFLNGPRKVPFRLVQAGINEAALRWCVLIIGRSEFGVIDHQLGKLTILLPTSRTSTRFTSMKPVAELTLRGKVI